MVEQFINNDMIRATVAVSPADLPDYLIDSLSIGDEIEVYLDEWLEDWRAILTDPNSLATPEDNPGEDPEDNTEDNSEDKPDPNLYYKAQTLLKVWLKYYAAYLVAGGARTFVLKMLTDGNNRSDRFDFDPQVIEARMKAKADEFKDKLDNLLGNPVISRRYSQFSTVPSGYDPVVGR